MAKIIGLANQKGGVGKTTLCREISACCALRGYQVLAVDCDPQGNLTTSWLTPGSYQYTLAHVLIEPPRDKDKKKVQPMELKNVIFESPVEGLDLAPADIRLARFDNEPDDAFLRLRSQLHKHASGYDLIFLDCPPQLGKLLIAALTAADAVLVPLKLDALSFEGLSDLFDTISRIQENANPNLSILGVIINLFRPARNLSSHALDAINEAKAMVKHVFKTNVHDYAEINEAPLHKLPTLLSAKGRPGAVQIDELTDEILDMLKPPRQKLELVAKK